MPISSRSRDVELLKDIGVAGEDSGEVHHLAKTHHAWKPHRLSDDLRRHLGAGTLHRAGWNAGRHGEKESDRERFGCLHQRADAGEPGNIRDLVRIIDNRSGAVGDDRPCILVDPQDRAFDMDVPVDKRGGEITPREIDRLPRFRVVAGSGDTAIHDHHIDPLDLARCHVDQSRVAEQKVRFSPALGNGKVSPPALYHHDHLCIPIPACSPDSV